MNTKKLEEDPRTFWRDLLTDVMLIDEIQTYGLHKHANKVALVICRSALIAFGIYFTYFIGCTRGTQYYGFFAFTAIIIAETIFICVKRDGIDFKWFSVSYLAYSVQFVAGLWIGSNWGHELEDIQCKGNETAIEFSLMHHHCSIPYLNSYCTSLTVFVCIWLMSIIFVRRHSPIEIENGTHSLLLIDYLTAAADIVDFTDYSHNESVSHHNGIHLVWALVMISSIQFSFALTAMKKMHFTSKGLRSMNDFFFGTEVWSIVLVLITMEFPYAIARTYFLASYGVLNDPTLFFLLKNIFMILEGLRRIFIFYFEYRDSKSIDIEVEIRV